MTQRPALLPHHRRRRLLVAPRSRSTSPAPTAHRLLRPRARPARRRACSRSGRTPTSSRGRGHAARQPVGRRRARTWDAGRRRSRSHPVGSFADPETGIELPPARLPERRRRPRRHGLRRLGGQHVADRAGAVSRRRGPATAAAPGPAATLPGVTAFAFEAGHRGRCRRERSASRLVRPPPRPAGRRGADDRRLVRALRATRASTWRQEHLAGPFDPEEFEARRVHLCAPANSVEGGLLGLVGDLDGDGGDLRRRPAKPSGSSLPLCRATQGPRPRSARSR